MKKQSNNTTLELDSNKLIMNIVKLNKAMKLRGKQAN